MTISELTKREILGRRNQIDSRLTEINKQVREYQAAIDTLRAEGKALLETREALKTDIPEPTVITM